MVIEPPASMLSAWAEWGGVCVAAAALARLLTLVVRPWVDGDEPRHRVDRLIEITFITAAAALWWWEAYAAGQLPPVGGAGPVDRGAIAARFLAHLVLGGLLAAATWVDLRHRVIPDAITMPGVLLGLVWTALDPEILLPVPREVARSFAAPLVRLDLLGAFGGLHAARLPSWCDPAPAASGLVLALAAFVAWWVTCTAPGDDDGRSPGTPWRLAIDGRSAVLLAGLTGVVVAWARGGVPWAAQLASLVGIVVAAGLVWLTRIGASWALDQEALGFGDVTLMAMAGAWLGWQPCVLAFFLAVFIGLAHGLWQLATRRGNELPFGPSLCAALAITVVAWRPLWEAAGPFFDRPGELAAVGGAVIALTAATLAIWRRLRGDRFSGV